MPFAQIVPLLSQSSHPLPSGFSDSDYDKLVNRIQFGGDEVVKAKDGAGSATLSMAYAGAAFAGVGSKGALGAGMTMVLGIKQSKDSILERMFDTGRNSARRHYTIERKYHQSVFEM